MHFTVYLLSTLSDLEAERRAVQDPRGGQCIVRHSYRASEDALVESSSTTSPRVIPTGRRDGRVYLASDRRRRNHDS